MSFSTRKSLAPPQQSGSRKDDAKREKLPILLANEEELAMRMGKITGVNDTNSEGNQTESDPGGRFWRDSSYKFWNDEVEIYKSAVNGESGSRVDESEVPKEISLYVDELQADHQLELSAALATATTSSVVATENSSEFKVSFSQPHTAEEEGVVKCSSNEVHQNKSSLLRSRPRSRLMDPIPPDLKRGKSGQAPGKSGQQKSGLFLSGRTEESEEDPFIGTDLPEEYKTVNISLATMAESVSLVLIITALVLNLTVPALRIHTLWDLDLWKWEVLLLVLICGRLLSGWAMRIVVFLIMRNFMLRKRVLYFVYGLRKAVQNCLWLGLVLLTWHFLFDKRLQREGSNKPLLLVTKILVCFLLATVIWLLKTLMVKVLASSFHVNTYFDRIHESVFNQYVIETLSGPPLVEIKNLEDEEARLAEDVQRLQEAGASVSPELKDSVFAKSWPNGKNDGIEKSPNVKNKSHMLSGPVQVWQDAGMPIDHFQRLNPKNVSAWNMKRLINTVRYGSLTTLDEQLHGATQEDEKQMHIRSEIEAKAAAKKIFQNVAKPHSKCIKLEDLMKFMEKDEAEKTLSLFEGALETRKISKASLKNWVVKAFRERRALSLTLNDTKTAIKTLHQMVNLIVAVVTGLIWLIILGVTTRKLIYLFGSQLVVCAFIFGNTLKNIFEALIFLFIIHPFDVGDRCEIDGNQYVVEEMNILSTVFLRDDNLKVTYMNNMLAMKAIHNYYRSPEMGDAIDFFVHISTPAEKIALIKQRITSYIESKKDHWSPSPMIVVRDFDKLERVKYSVWLSHTINHQDMGEKFERRAKLVEEMVNIFKEVDLEYRINVKEISLGSISGPNSARLPPSRAPNRN